MSKPTLVYFASRGRAELIRIILAEASVAYLEHPVGQGTAPVNGRVTDFATYKVSPACPFGAAPVWEEPDGFVLAQSGAIAMHLARQHGLVGSTPRHAARCDEMMGCFDDVRAELRKLATVPPEGRAAQRESLATQFLPRWFGYFDRRLAANTGGAGFLVGDTLTVADLALWYLIELCQDNGFGAAVTAYPALAAYAGRIGKRPSVAAYVNSPQRPAFAPLPR